METLHLVADDVTGALDTAAQFACGGRVLPVFYSARPPDGGSCDFALDLGTREVDVAWAEAAAASAAHLLRPGPGLLAFKKVDSLLRGHPAAELAATLKALGPTRCAIAPAFPHHGRVTRGGRQFLLQSGGWHPVGESIGVALRLRGVEAKLVRPGDPVPDGVSLWDAETDGDLQRIAADVRKLGQPVLWCGSAGLAGALAGGEPTAAQCRRPLLGIFGSEHEATAAQLAACADHVVWIRQGWRDAAQVRERLERTGICMAAVRVPAGIGRAEAAARISREVAALVHALPVPASALVSGGETLRALCEAVEARHLDVFGQVAPGIPVSTVAGGRWSGVLLASKSGSFGDDGFLVRHFLAPGA